MTEEEKMVKAVQTYLRKKGWHTASEISLFRTRFDLVAYHKKRKEFRVIECKPTNRDTGIGRAFGQLATYHGTVKENGLEFVDVVSQKLPNMSFRKWMEATDWAKQFKVSFYVALSHNALLDLKRIRRLKSILPQFGIIRVRPNRGCRSYLYTSKKSYRKLASAKPIEVRIDRSWR